MVNVTEKPADAAGADRLPSRHLQMFRRFLALIRHDVIR
jgi:hypothetical protein